jgi:hypothetical protein
VHSVALLSTLMAVPPASAFVFGTHPVRARAARPVVTATVKSREVERRDIRLPGW